MRPKTFLRTIPVVLTLALLLAAAAPAAARPAPDGAAGLWQWLADLAGLSYLAGEDGGWIDPNGANAGATDHGEDGNLIDPNGATADTTDNGEVGTMIDPDG